MGPKSSSCPFTPSHPWFDWDIKTAPCTDGLGSQENYARAVNLWTHFHDKLLGNNSNNISFDLHEIFLKSQLFGRGLDLCKERSNEYIASEHGARPIVKMIFKRNALFVVSDMYQDFTKLLNVRRGTTETYRNYESLMSAQICKLSAHGDTVKLRNSLSAFMLPANASVKDA